eukprot:1315600-Prymnesium_polylepis.1
MVSSANCSGRSRSGGAIAATAPGTTLGRASCAPGRQSHRRLSPRTAWLDRSAAAAQARAPQWSHSSLMSSLHGERVWGRHEVAQKRARKRELLTAMSRTYVIRAVHPRCVRSVRRRRPRASWPRDRQ